MKRILAPFAPSQATAARSMAWRVFAAFVPALGASAFAAKASAAASAPLLPHQAPLQLDGAGTAWMLVSTGLVLLMTLPGLALFYAGMVRRKNVLATISQSVAITAVISLLWFGIGYSLAFSAAPGWLQALIGGVDVALLDNVTVKTANSAAKGIPEFLFVAYQMTFAVITPALITGAFAERLKFTTLLLFCVLWHLIVYAPVAHWVWGGGFLGRLGVLDFAGGTVVHISSGVAGLVCALVLGPRRGFRRDNMAPNDLAMSATGASLLLFGWVGFNAGSAFAADAIASVALLNTLLAAAAGAVGWTIVEWIERRKPTLLGMITGLVGGLVAVTPAAGFVDPKGAVLIGLAAGLGCYAAAVWLKTKLGYDDSLDSFGVHGVGGLIGALLTGPLASALINPAGAGGSLFKQAIGVSATILWSGLGTFGVLLVCRAVTGLRVKPEDEVSGLDYALHGEALHGSSG